MTGESRRRVIVKRIFDRSRLNDKSSLTIWNKLKIESVNNLPEGLLTSLSTLRTPRHFRVV
ncbi:hypothetical protein, partial [Photorhabdus viridis]|uniref:hypothetical protein n=1 Tax=Photorhabdus viridis TaxID=3163327 RepID=UPI003306FBA5